MKTLALIVVCYITLVACHSTNAQEQEEKSTPDQAMFDRGISFCDKGDFASGAAVFRKFMVEYPTSPMVARAHYNVGYLSFKLKDYEVAKLILNEILEKPYNEQDENDLMEPYALYKHHACRLLAEIALEEKDYDAAEKYIHLFDEEYPYQHFCGNEWAAYHMYVATMRARLYEGRNEIQNALQELLPYIFDNGLASNKNVLDEIVFVLEKNYSKEAIQMELNRALASLSIKEAKKQKRYSMMLYGVKVDINPYFVNDDKSKTTERERYEKAVKENALFKKFL